MFKKKSRIVKKTGVDGKVWFTIQTKHPIFRYWCDAWLNSWEDESCQDSFDTLEETKKNLCYFDGSKVKMEIIND